jgi:hypothetical protein
MPRTPASAFAKATARQVARERENGSASAAIQEKMGYFPNCTLV